MEKKIRVILTEDDENLGLWFEGLKRSRQNDQAILSIFVST